MLEEELTDQERAIRLAIDWWQSGAQEPFVLSGMAGTGKTSTARRIADSLVRHASDVVFLAPTGKAAKVLIDKGCPATTIHSAIYVVGNDRTEELHQIEEDIAKVLKDHKCEHPREVAAKYPKIANYLITLQKRRQILKTDTIKWILKTEEHAFGGRLPKLIVLDESSMVDEEMASDLKSFGVPIIALGDQGQLPPVNGGPGFPQHRPNATLTTPRRTDNLSVLVTSWCARDGKRLPPFDGVAGLVSEAYGVDYLNSFDQVICRSNVMRWRLIDAMRAQLGRPAGVPVPGDRVICCRNNLNLDVVNGQQALVHHVRRTKATFALSTDAGEWLCDPDGFDGLEGERRAGVNKNPHVVMATFANAITCHKSQGSQWPRVAVIDEPQRGRFKKDPRWLYTAVTRAVDSVAVFDRLPS